MNNKLIITENQYNRLLLSINEMDEATKYDTTIKEPNLAKIKDTILSVKPNNELIFSLIDGTTITMCFIGDKNDLYVFKVKNIKGSNKFDYLIDNFININKNITTDNLRIVKDGVYEIIFKFYRVNKKLFKIEKLKFNFVKIGGGCNVVNKNKLNNKKEPVMSGGTGEEKDNINYDDVRDEAQKAYKLIISNPDLKQAFYKAPSLWNLFVAELKGKKAPGKGIIPTLDLVGSYNNRLIKEKLNANFIPSLPVLFKLYKNSPIPEAFSADKNYTAIVVEDREKVYGRIYLEVDGDNGVKYTINPKSEINTVHNGYYATIKNKKDKEEKTKDIQIIILEPSEGYSKIEKK